MADSVFVDSSGWIALINEEDEYHVRARAWFQQNKRPLCTSDYVLGEMMTYLRFGLKQHAHRKAVAFGRNIGKSNITTRHNITDEDWNQALEIFEQYEDQDFSFTDCTSFALMQRLDIRDVLTFDKHFSTMGFVQVA